jgi:hypothetical protein
VREAFAERRIDVDVLREITKRYLRSGDFKEVFRSELKVAPAALEARRKALQQLHEAAPSSTSSTAVGEESVDVSKKNELSIQKSQANTKSLLPPVVAAVIAGSIIAVLLLLSYS